MTTTRERLEESGGPLLSVLAGGMLALGMLGGVVLPSDAPPVAQASPAPAQVGQWSTPLPLPLVAVHAALLANGHILAWDGQTWGYTSIVLDPLTGVTTPLAPPVSNVFCTGLCALPDGRIFVAGGHGDVNGHVGVTNLNLFDPIGQRWTTAAPMAYPRWYPTVTALPDGRMQVTAGEMNGDRDVAVVPEIYDPRTNQWTSLEGAALDLPYYPHMFVLPDGRLLAASTTEDAIETFALSLPTQTWTVIDPIPVDGGSAVQYLPGKILKAGTSADSDPPYFPSAPTAYVLDMTSPAPAWRPTGSMAFARTYLNLTLLPDGTVLATGGGASSVPGGLPGAVHAAEIWSPTTETWTTMASMQAPRLYHSTALLLQDGRVITMGGGRFFGPPESEQFSAEIFSPPYLFKGLRPILASVPLTATYGTVMPVGTPDAARIASVALLKLGTVTHAFNQEQRYVPLAFTHGVGRLNVQMPLSPNLAPPGYYMLFIVDTTGVPSVGAIFHVQATP